MLPSQGLLRLAVRDLTRSFESNRGARELRSGHWQARVSSSLVRGHGLGCPTVPGSMRSRDPRYAACDGAHGAGAGCAPRAGTFKARHAPLGYQYPIWGRAAWGAGYAQRTAVERGYSLFKNPDVVGMARTHFRLRGLVNLTLLSVLGWIAHNLHLRQVERRGAARPPTPPPRPARLALAA